jgi:tight adherence protein C
MSSLWLALALVGTFMTIVIVGVLIDMFLRERQRPLTILQSQVGQVSESVNLREQELQGSVLDRMVVPGAKRLGTTIVRLTPFDLHSRIDRKLVLAGSPPGMDAERIVALKIIACVGMLVAGVFVSAMLPISGLVRLVFIVAFALIGYQMPSMRITSMAVKRQKTIRRQLSDVMDLLTISVEAGLGFDAALAQVVRNVPGPLADEMGRMLQEVQIGASRADAFSHMGSRTDVPELQGFVLSMIQADMFGVSIANVLRAQSKELRQKRRQMAEEMAQKIPVKLLFPMIFLILPAMFIVILGPGAIKLYTNFF